MSATGTGPSASPPAGLRDPDALRDPNLMSIPPVLGQGGLVGSFRAAILGVLRTVASQRNMKIHVLSAQMVMIVGMALPLDLSTRTTLLFCVAFVFFAEILNTALEAFVDLHIREFHRLAMMAKDAAAAGVLVLAATTVVVLGEILWTNWHVVTANLDAVGHALLFGVPLVLFEAAGLFFAFSGALSAVRAVLSAGALVALALRSQDPFFVLVAAALLVVALLARSRFAQPVGRSFGHGA